jgi:small-conductance mechanosensitive channel
LDTGEVAKVPNAVLKDSMVISRTNTVRRMVRVRLDLPTKVPIDDFENTLRELLISDGIKDVKVFAEETWQQLETYQVAIVAYGDLNLSPEELKSIVLKRAIEVRSRLTKMSNG